MLQVPDIFDESHIVDEIIDFLTSASQISLYATQTIMTHFACDPLSVAKVRAEAKSTIDTDTVMKQDYMDRVLKEALRYNPPAIHTW